MEFRAEWYYYPCVGEKKGQLAIGFSLTPIYYFSGHTGGNILAINRASLAVVENCSMWEKSVLIIVSILVIRPYKLKVFTNENLRQKLNKLTDEGIQTLSEEDSA